VFHSSVCAVIDWASPPILKAAALLPADAISLSASFKGAVVDQLVPFQFCVASDLFPVGPSSPPKAKAAVLDVPAPLPPDIGGAFKSFTSVQLVPFHNSVTAVPPPPKANADVLVPALPKFCLAVFKSLTSVQFVPFQFSVLPVFGGVPPKARDAVFVAPAPAKLLLAVVKVFTSV
jgi:hypothetical protein